MFVRMRIPTLRTSIVVLAITLAVTTPALAHNNVPGHPGWDISDKGFIGHGDIGFGNCTALVKQWHSGEFSKNGRVKRGFEFLVNAARVCESLGYTAKGPPTQDSVESQPPLTKTGGPPLILVPIALLIVSGLLIRKSTAL
jgi:hypothetical protein